MPGLTKEGTVRRLNLNLLYPLDAILHASTLTEAGRRVNLSQSAMSHALRRLRDHFGDDLVAHQSGEQHLTPLGRALRGEVRRALQEVHSALEFSLEFNPRLSTENVTIAVSEAIEQMLLAPVLRNLSREAPHMTVDLTALGRKSPWQSLEEGADLVLVLQSGADERLASLPILSDHTSCMVWSEHPELGSKNEITDEQYRTGRHIVASGESTPIIPGDALAADILNSRKISIKATSQATLPAIVIESDLIATGSSWLFQYYASNLPLKVLATPFTTVDTPIVAQWPSHRRRDPMLDWFLQKLLDRRPF
jgi:DNA-binding transcriptional LysR family regulator